MIKLLLFYFLVFIILWMVACIIFAELKPYCDKPKAIHEWEVADMGKMLAFWPISVPLIGVYLLAIYINKLPMIVITYILKRLGYSVYEQGQL
jgi:hypothetical protein